MFIDNKLRNLYMGYAKVYGSIMIKVKHFSPFEYVNR